MVETTASKLMLANDEIEDKERELNNLRLAFNSLEASFNTLLGICSRQLSIIEELQKKPWWKFW